MIADFVEIAIQNVGIHEKRMYIRSTSFSLCRTFSRRGDAVSQYMPEIIEL